MEAIRESVGIFEYLTAPRRRMVELRTKQPEPPELARAKAA